MGTALNPDVIIAGAGIIGLSLALELHARGLAVTVLDRNAAMAEASTAAAGMLAVTDPDNPAALLPLSQLSAALYPHYLDRIRALSGRPVPFQTHTTLQQDGPAPPLTTPELRHHLTSNAPSHISFSAIPEHSLDPRQLAPALLNAVRNAGIVLREQTPVLATTTHPHAIELHTPSQTLTAPYFIDCTGAWTRLPSDSAAVFPLKGQMLAVATPAAAPLAVTVRTHELYLVPRTTGPNAGRIIIGATLEEAGYSKSTDAASLEHLRRRAVQLFPPLATSPILEQWAGLRPATRDRLPVLGAHPDSPR